MYVREIDLQDHGHAFQEELVIDANVPIARSNHRQGCGEITLYGQRCTKDLLGAYASRLRTDLLRNIPKHTTTYRLLIALSSR